MCGICGIIDGNQITDRESVVQRMMHAMQHRGPDDQGTVEFTPVAVGMRRLSIIDLEGGRQPVFNEDKTLAVVFNGEIYNFQEVRKELESRGHVFSSRSDTEAIVHAYEEWGPNCLDHLRGMFAFAIVEAPKEGGQSARRVFLARDRLGIKPLYYTFVGETLLFASEVKALLATGLIPRVLSLSALESYLLFGSVGEPMTLIEGVLSLPPGHRMLVSVGEQGRHPIPEPYWDLPVPEPNSRACKNGNRQDVVRELRSLLEESVRMHQISDVPLGIFLSSGIDSTVLAALAGREHADVMTFTVVFPEQKYSEARLARRSAEQFHTTHQEFMLSGEEMLARLDEALAGQDQPTIDGINTYLVSWAARETGLKVALSGLGGDEVFGGYSTFRTTRQLKRVAALARRLPPRWRSGLGSPFARIGELRRPADATRKAVALWRDPDAFPHPYYFARALFTPNQVSALMSEAQSLGSVSLWWGWLAEAARKADHLDHFASVSYLETHSYLASTLLRDADVMSMARSLEVRVPFLDHRLVEFVARQPESIKTWGGKPKSLLVEALKDVLPLEVVGQRKRTFTFPWERWLRGPLRDQVGSGLADFAPSLQKIFHPGMVCSLWQDFLRGGTSWSRPWSLYVLNEWAKRHLESR